MENQNDRVYFFRVSNGIFEHWRRIQNALWLFEWYIDKTTREDDQPDGSKVGLVLGGMPVRDCEVATVFGCSRRIAFEWRQHLQSQGYIDAKRTPYGYVIKVKNSKKWDPERSAKVAGTCEPNVHQRSTDSSQRSTDSSQRCELNVHLIKTIQDTTRPTSQPEKSGLVGRLDSLFVEKTTQRLRITAAQRAKLTDLESQHGDSVVVEAFKQWLKRSQGLDGLKWPLGVFLGEFDAYVREANEVALRERFKGWRCPKDDGPVLFVGGHPRCGWCGGKPEAA
jgi:hypothetical protein